MKDSTKDKAAGSLHEAKGAVKQGVGHALNKPNLEAEGAAEKVGGKMTSKKQPEVKVSSSASF